MKKFIYLLSIIGLLASPLLANKNKKKIAVENIIENPAVGKQWLKNLVTTVKQNAYDKYLIEIDNYYLEAIKEKQFDQKITFSKKSMEKTNQDAEKIKQFHEKYFQKISKLEEKTNNKLRIISEKNPHFQISNIINAYVDHHNLKLQNLKTDQDIKEVLLGIKEISETDQEILSQIKIIFNEYEIKKDFLTSNLFIPGKICKDTYFSLDQILQMEKYEKLKEICKNKPNSILINILQEKIKTFEAYFPYMYEENYLISLVKENNKKFANKTEKNTAKIISSYIAEKQQLISL